MDIYYQSFLVYGYLLSELKTLELNILNPDRLINLENKQYLIWRLRKRGDQALISLSTSLKFYAQNTLDRPRLHKAELFNVDNNF